MENIQGRVKMTLLPVATWWVVTPMFTPAAKAKKVFKLAQKMPVGLCINFLWEYNPYI
jgi:hypothetical protein